MELTFGDLTVRLTPEQVQVMCLVARGLYYREIADRLGYSERTIKARVCDVKNRMGTDSRAVALLAMRDAGVLR